jgi:predicted ATP-grasp superfamily ATP-dependent carboligase
MKALIVHSRRTGLGLIRSLGKNKVEVYCSDVYKSEGFYSKYTKKGFVLPKLIEDGSAYVLESLINIGKEICVENEKIFLFTGSDDYLLFFVQNWDRLSLFYEAVFETSLEKLSPCLEKKGMYILAESSGVPIPKTYYSPVRPSDVESYPVIIKPTLKKTDKIDVVKEAFRIRKAHNESELEKWISKLDKIKSPYVVQKYIEGKDDSLYTAGIFAYKGKLCAIGTSRKLRQFPPSLGECSLGELIKAPNLELYSERLIKKAGITGMCQIEFKKNDNDFFLMEINPRPWSWNSIIEYAGINLPYLAISIISGDKPVPLKPELQKTYDGRWMYMTMDLKYNILRNFNQSIFGYLKDILKAKRYAFWSLSDPIPFFIHFYYAFYYEFLVPKKKKFTKKYLKKGT